VRGAVSAPGAAAAVAAPARARTAPVQERRPGAAPQPERTVHVVERSGRRPIALIAGGVIAIVAAVVLAVVLLGGSSPSKSAKSSSVSTVVAAGKKSSTAHAKKSSQSSHAATVANPAETTVAVLNGTETQGLAHRVSTALQQHGYSQANALNGRPPGSGQVTVVEYSAGHQAEAEGVARTRCRSNRCSHSKPPSRVSPARRRWW
jgi:hypothetical protein